MKTAISLVLAAAGVLAVPRFARAKLFPDFSHTYNPGFFLYPWSPYSQWRPPTSFSSGGYTVMRPGQPPIFLMPDTNGGYQVLGNGTPTFIDPDANGGWEVQRAGHLPTFIDPQN
jgi:hypothetical protein